ncbi:MAG: hypothetical protein IPP06_16565 [Saprospiraceae bacterium]|nr:hypothetical protein [Candidatus Vicinibacter affinis]
MKAIASWSNNTNTNQTIHSPEQKDRLNPFKRNAITVQDGGHFTIWMAKLDIPDHVDPLKQNKNSVRM